MVFECGRLFGHFCFTGNFSCSYDHGPQDPKGNKPPLPNKIVEVIEAVSKSCELLTGFPGRELWQAVYDACVVISKELAWFFLSLILHL